MKENGLPRIIYKKTNFSCFFGIVKGSIEASVYDQGTNEFSTLITVETNWGDGSIPFPLKGNETFSKKVQDIDIEVNVSKWKCDNNELSFHVKAVAKKVLSCTVIDENFSGTRHNKEQFAKKIAALHTKAEAIANT